MKRLAFCGVVLLLGTSGSVLATTSFEPQRKSERVTYGSDWIEAQCEAACRIDVHLSDHDFRIDDTALPKGIVISPPAHLALIYDPAPGVHEYTVKLEVECDEYAEGRPTYICMGYIRMKGDRLIDVVRVRRYNDDLPSPIERFFPENKA